MKDTVNLRLILLLLLPVIFLVTVVSTGSSLHDPLVSIGDVTRIKGVRDNQLFGFGLVIGLAGTGDSNRYRPTITSHANMLRNLGIEVTPDQINSRNVAAVMVTGSLSVFDHPGDPLDVTISSLGDATSLQGGVLFMTALMAANGENYAAAQGPVSIGGFNLQAGGNMVRKNHPTVAMVPSGAIVERGLDFKISNQELTFLLKEANFETARNVALAINRFFDVIYTEEKVAEALDAAQIRVKVPLIYQHDVVDYIAKINNLEVRPGLQAKVVINEKTGTIIIGHNVRISTISVAHGNLTVRIDTERFVSQPPPFSPGETVVVEETSIEVLEQDAHMMVVPTGGNVQDLVAALNTIGASPRDIIAILQMIDAQGALHARLELR
ncbi:MAG: flagellar basal body P-ring protein FlgI [Halanaerobiales bacterium]|nr:flagellar basal body P-ring protein FlgI [Halanaerobiales bacterium]